ncbi:MAG: AAA family ATPase, partial [Proteobacteria bacterium]|nr:AAA family ATPase [Pseudomonadota bacterium]
MLKTLRIKNFKSILDANLELGRVNLFVGGNGSGKSNLLEAVGVLSGALGRGVMPLDLDAKGVRLSLPHLFKSTFKNRNITKTFRLEAGFGNASYSVSLTAGERSDSLNFFSEELREHGKKVFGRSPHGARMHLVNVDSDLFSEDDLPKTRGMWDVFSLLADTSRETDAAIDTFTRFASYTPQTAVMRGVSTDNRAVEPLGLTGSRLATAFRETLKHIKEHRGKDRESRLQEIINVIWESGWAKRVRIAPPDPDIVPDFVATAPEMVYIEDKYMRGGRNHLSPYDASEGTLYLIFVATLLAHPETPKA